MKFFIFIAVAIFAVSVAKADTEVLLDSIVTFNEEGVPKSKELQKNLHMSEKSSIFAAVFNKSYI